MKTDTKAEAVAALVSAARDIAEDLASNLSNDAHVIESGEAASNPRDLMNFSVGALLPIEKAAADLLALLAAARALQGVK